MNNTEKLLKGHNQPSNANSTNRLSALTNKMTSICDSLSQDSNYDPKDTIKHIDGYINGSDKISRVLYSEISNYVFVLDEETRGVFSTNVEELLEYSLTESDTVNADIQDVVIRIYDHFNLALKQIEKISDVSRESTNRAKIDFADKLKDIEKNYIAILGIFAAVVLTFIGGTTFSSAILQNIHQASIYRIIIAIAIIGLFISNIIYSLFNFIVYITDRSKKRRNISNRMLNGIFLALILLSVVTWWFGCIEYRNHKFEENKEQKIEEVSSTLMPTDNTNNMQ